MGQILSGGGGSGKYAVVQHDKADWPDGPWKAEPDFVSWTDAATGYQCFMKRSPTYGFWMGYVGVDENHPWFSKKYQAVERQVEVHGGLTYSGPSGYFENVRWCFGFDCGHWDDVRPKQAHGILPPHCVYRTVDYVIEQVESLARQLASQ